MRRLGLCLGLALGLSLMAASPARAQDGGPRFEPSACAFDTPPGEAVECGYLVVPEDRAQPSGRAIRLAVAIIKSRALDPAPDPLIFLNGGPGAPALQDLPRFAGFYRLLMSGLDRDLVLFDQRGVGASQPALECPELAPMLLRQAHGAALAPAEIQAPYLACRDRWLAAGVNLAAYGTTDSAADVRDLWRALGYERVNLVGVSYGTVLAQTVMRDHASSGRIRSVILDSPYPLGISLFADMAANMSGALERIFAACVADWLCRAAYPEAEAEFYHLLDSLERQPVKLTAEDPFTGEAFAFEFGAADLVDLLATAQPRQAPGLIYDLRDGDYAAAVEARQAQLANLYLYGPPPSRAMAYSVGCSQGLYAATAAQMAAATSFPEFVWVERFIFRDFIPVPCEAWPSRPRDTRPVAGDMPVLALLGEYDHTLSPGYADLLARDLSSVFILDVPNAAHGVLAAAGACANSAARAFLDDPARPPEAACLASTGRPLLDTRFVIRAAAARRPTAVALALMGLGVGWAAVRGGVYVLKHRAGRAAAPAGFTWRNSFRRASWRSAAGAALLVWLALLSSQTGWLSAQLVRPENVIAVLLPAWLAFQAVFVFSPEDEPALEVLMSASRPLVWTVLERLAALVVLVGGVGLAASLYAAALTGEAYALTVARWLPPMIFLGSLAVYLTLAFRRADLGLIIVCLVWLALAVFGDLMVSRWPFAWPIHLYLQPDHAAYGLNRLFISLLGLGLLAYAGARLLNDEERLLLGYRPGRNKSGRGVGSPGAARGEPARADAAGLRPRPSAAAQIVAMVRYEFRLQWRRRALVILLGAVMTTPLLGALLSRAQFAGYAADLARADITLAMQALVWGSLSMALMLALPIVVADMIPKDRQHGVREVLASLPLPPGVYLTGKVFSLWASLLAGLAFAALVSGLAWRLLVGPFFLDVYVEMWLLGAVPMALINSTTAMCLAAGQPTRRRALLVGLVFAAACLGAYIFFFSAVLTGWAPADSAWHVWNPARPALILRYLAGWPGAEAAATEDMRAVLALVRALAPRRAVFLSLGAGAAQAALTWLGAWLWLRRRSGLEY